MTKSFIIKLSTGAVIILLVMLIDFMKNIEKNNSILILEQIKKFNVQAPLYKNIEVGKSKMIDFLQMEKLID